MELGAEVWLEPDMTHAQIDHCMKLLADAQMPVARIFLEWNPDPQKRGAWQTGDVYDHAFDSAARHGIGIVATCTPPFPARTHAQLEASRQHVSALVARYKDHPALDTWLLINEPSASPSDSEVAMEAYIPWLKVKYGTIGELNRVWMSCYQSFEQLEYQPSWRTGGTWDCGAFVDTQTFWREHHAWQLNFIADTIRAQDAAHPIHVNPHGLLGNLAGMGDDLPTWRTFLSTLGASLHPAWHFGLLQRRNQFALGTSYICDLVRGASEPNPFWVTELQGGNNIYSGTQPLCPEPEDIAQWTWTGIASGARRVIYWLLNARTVGIEAGEWSLLDFQHRPSERLETAGSIASTLRREAAFFSSARPLETPISIILSLETMTVQQRFGDEGGDGHILEALGLYEAFQELGVPVQVKHIHDFAWDTASGTPQFVVLPHVSALSGEQSARISEFVRAGNHVLATGLTGFYDPMTHVWPLGDFPLADAFGGTFKEARYLSQGGLMEMGSGCAALPTHRFTCDIENQSGDVLCQQGQRVLATAHHYGAGQVHWLPSLIGMGAWLGDRRPLATFLNAVAGEHITMLPIRFAEYAPGVLLRTLHSGEEFVTVITNGTDKARSCRLVTPGSLRPRTLWSTQQARLEGDTVSLGGRGTLVVHWAT